MSISLFESQMAMYTTYHRDPRNRMTHFFGIPAIVVSLLIVLALVQVHVAGVEFSLALVVAAAVSLLWACLNLAIGSAMLLFLLPSLLFAEWLVANLTPAVVWSIFAGLFVGGWILQLWGHVYEGRRPALISNLFQALIGPMFLVAELFFALGLKLKLKRKIEEIIAERYPDYVESASDGADSAQPI
ncbi:DUF962 domain-containing protein [Pelagibius sp. Alg239-R121]|uniref:Mpo1 family 2-hydroxy fatty acid dioxygenase n=1 Tax=Pelagibius sp. Alg239-R121 TaxID=2993448 RepID=UPI0024A659AB|nr:Mpo1-like protein [Pelagibius sp. Alg239-R121]